VFLRFFGRGFHGILGGKGSAFPRALEAETPGTAPGYGIPLFIGDVNYGVIKCGVYMAYTLWHIFFLFSPCAADLCHSFSCSIIIVNP
jgi:hypothetical protein